MVITVFIAEMAIGQHDDKAANVADEVIQPTCFKNGVMHTFMLQREMMHQYDALNEHGRPNQP